MAAVKPVASSAFRAGIEKTLSHLFIRHAHCDRPTDPALWGNLVKWGYKIATLRILGWAGDGIGASDEERQQSMPCANDLWGVHPTARPSEQSLRRAMEARRRL
jgi:hypothetical protein